MIKSSESGKYYSIQFEWMYIMIVIMSWEHFVLSAGAQESQTAFKERHLQIIGSDLFHGWIEREINISVRSVLCLVKPPIVFLICHPQLNRIVLKLMLYFPKMKISWKVTHLQAIQYVDVYIYDVQYVRMRADRWLKTSELSTSNPNNCSSPIMHKPKQFLTNTVCWWILMWEDNSGWIFHWRKCYYRLWAGIFILARGQHA